MPYPEAGVDISDANAVEADVRSGKTFYSIAPPKKTGTLDLSEHQNAEATNVGATNDTAKTGYYTAVVAAGTIISASITLTKRSMVVVVSIVLIPSGSKSTSIQRTLNVDKETTISPVNFGATNLYAHVQYGTEVLDAGTYTYKVIAGVNLNVYGSAIKIVAVTV
jgi:hypothetical protein